MKKNVRIGNLKDQDTFRREDIRKMSPNERVSMLVSMQYDYFRWDKNPRMQKIATIKRVAGQNTER